MDRVSRKVIERLFGTGQLYQGKKFLRQVAYELTVSEEIHHVGTSAIGGLQSIEGRFTDGGDLSDLLGRDVTLHLGNGYRLDCVISDIRGRVVAAGGRGLYIPDDE